MGNRTEGRRNEEGLQSRKESVLLRSPFALLMFACLLLMLACLQPPLVHRALKHRTVRKARSEVRTEPMQNISKWLPCHHGSWVADNSPHRLWVTTAKPFAPLSSSSQHQLSRDTLFAVNHFWSLGTRSREAMEERQLLCKLQMHQKKCWAGMSSPCCSYTTDKQLRI